MADLIFPGGVRWCRMMDGDPSIWGRAATSRTDGGATAQTLRRAAQMEAAERDAATAAAIGREMERIHRVRGRDTWLGLWMLACAGSLGLGLLALVVLVAFSAAAGTILGAFAAAGLAASLIGVIWCWR